MATHREIIRDASGEVLAEMCVRSPLSDEERATMAEYFTWVRSQLPEPTPEQVERQRLAGQRNHDRLVRLGVGTHDRYDRQVCAGCTAPTSREADR